MWYRLEYKKTARSRKWHFICLCGDKDYLETRAKEYNASGIIARVVLNEE